MVSPVGFVDLSAGISIIIKPAEAPIKFADRFETTSRNNAHGRVITIVIVFLGRWGKHADDQNNVVPRYQTFDSRA